MARDFDGTNDTINCGSDAALDNIQTLSVCYWVERDVQNAVHCGVAKDRAASSWQVVMAAGGTRRLTVTSNWSGGLGEWVATTTGVDSGSRYHITVIYDRTSSANDPAAWINGVSQTISEVTAPSGTLATDEAQNLHYGENAAGNQDLDGRLACIIVHNGVLFTAAEANRAMWWGRPKGGLVVYHPFWTDKLANEGTATATGSATGTTSLGFAIPTVRPGHAMMGGGVGW